MNVIKRDGAKVPFDKTKIENAISKAFLEVDGKIYEDETIKEIAECIQNKIGEDCAVENIQDLVEEELWASDRPDVARAYTRFRYKKEVARNKKTDFIDSIREKLDASDIQNQNANVDEHSFGGRTGEASGVVTKQLALDYIVSEKARKNHLNNEIYIHDLDSYYVGSHNCLSIPFDDLLAKGFKTRQTDVRSAGSVNTAFQLVAVIFQLQSLQQFGGVSATHLDWTMVPYVRKSFYKHYIDGLHYIESTKANAEIKLVLNKEEAEGFSIEDKKVYNHSMAYAYAIEQTKKEIHQAVEGLYHNLNTLQSRSGNQLN